MTTRRPLTPTLSPIGKTDGGEGAARRAGSKNRAERGSRAERKTSDRREAQRQGQIDTERDERGKKREHGIEAERDSKAVRRTETGPDTEALQRPERQCEAQPPSSAQAIPTSRPNLIERLARAQAERAERSLLRRLRTVDSASGVRIRVDGQALLNFASNDYLGLAQHPAVTEALVRGAARWGVGATAAHLLGGHREEHAALEEKLARWTGRERALLFSTGYMANVGAMQALFGAGEAGSNAGEALCVQDKLNHASLIDAAKLAGAELKRYVHGDAGSAQRQLDTRPDAPAMVATDGVFSMDGDIAPLGELATLCHAQQATLMVDDAHGLGVLGGEGAGSLAEAGLTANDVPVLMATLGKALGVGGAFVAGSAALVDGLVQFARSHIYTTAMPPALAAAISVAVDIARFEDWRRDKLARLIRHFRHGAAKRGIQLMASRTPIQPVVIGSSAAALSAMRSLESDGFYVPAIRPPTVPKDKARLRVVLSARHEEGDVERLLNALARAVGHSRTQH